MSICYFVHQLSKTKGTLSGLQMSRRFGSMQEQIKLGGLSLAAMLNATLR